MHFPAFILTLRIARDEEGLHTADEVKLGFGQYYIESLGPDMRISLMG